MDLVLWKVEFSSWRCRITFDPRSACVATGMLSTTRGRHTSPRILNQRVPEGYFAEGNVQFGIEIDVATFEEAGPESTGNASLGARNDSLLTGSGPGWSVPIPTQTVPIAILTDTVEVLVFNREAGPTLAGAIELVSPANKDRPARRDAFVCKCAAYLQQGVGLVVVDTVTDRRANLHDELLARLRAPGGAP